MRYYRLLDDLYIPNRWHLGDVSASGVDMKASLDSLSYLATNTVDVEISSDGSPLDYSHTAFGVPVAKTRLAQAVGEVSPLEVQRIPARVGPYGQYEVLHCIRSVACLDENRSTTLKWLPGDHRPDKVGQYRMVIDLRVDAGRIPTDAHFFRIEGWAVALIVSARAKECMHAVGCFGAKFEEV
jgi:hypothetical protein